MKYCFEKTLETDLRLSQVEEKLDHAEKSNAELKNEVSEQKKAIDAKDDAIRQYKYTLDHQKDSLDRAMQTANELKIKVDQNDQEKDKKIQALTAALDKIKNDYTALDTQLSVLKKTISDKDIKMDKTLLAKEKEYLESKNKLIEALKQPLQQAPQVQAGALINQLNIQPVNNTIVL